MATIARWFSSKVLLDEQERSKARTSAVPVLLVALALAINLGSLLAVRRHGTVETLDADEHEYWDLAEALLRGGIDALPARRTLPFPAILATLRALVGNDYIRVQIALLVVLSLSPLLLYLLVRRCVGSERVARLAAIGFLLWPPFVRYGITLYSDSPALLTFLAFLVAFTWASERRNGPEPLGASWGRWLVAGGLLALCIQMKPLYLLYAPIAFVLAVASEQGPKQRARAGTLLTIGCLLVLLPWSAYLSRREGRFLLISANDAETLAGGLNPELLRMDGTGFYVSPENRVTWVGPGKWLNPAATGYLRPEELELPYGQARKLLAERSMSWIRSHPREVMYITARKLLYMWGIYPFWNGAAQSLLGNCLLLPLMGLAGLGVWRSRQNGSRFAVFWTLPIFSSLIACISWGSWRFRMPGDVGLIVLAAALVLPRQRD